MAESALLRELPVYGCLDLRIDARREAVAGAAAKALGAPLPGPNRWIAVAGAQILWQAHDAWLVLTVDGRQAVLAASLRAALSGVHCAITDVSDLRAVFELRGAHARDVLQKGCAVDLHPRVFASGTCVTTALARIRATLMQVEDTPAYEILVERSYGAYLRDWLNDAGAEYA